MKPLARYLLDRGLTFCLLRDGDWLVGVEWRRIEAEHGMKPLARYLLDRGLTICLLRDGDWLVRVDCWSRFRWLFCMLRDGDWLVGVDCRNRFRRLSLSNVALLTFVLTGRFYE